MKVPQWLLKAKERTERFLKDFEWTWTTAVLFSWVRLLLRHHDGGHPFVLAVLRRADARMGRPVGTGEWQPLARDAVAMGLATGPFITALIAAVILQNWRRKLRGGSADRPTGGYR